MMITFQMLFHRPHNSLAHAISKCADPNTIEDVADADIEKVVQGAAEIDKEV